MSLEGFRRGAQSIIQGSKTGGSGKKGGYWLQWKAPHLPAGSPQPVAQPFMFIDADYQDFYELDKKTGQPTVVPFYHGREHNFRNGPKDFRSTICSAGFDPHNPRPCIGDYESDHGRKGANARDFMAFNVAHLIPYHYIQYVKNDVPQFKKDNPQEPVMITVECEFRGCKHCAVGAQMKFGEHRVLKVGTGHLQAILQWEAKIGNTCANCGSNIIVQAYDCPNCNNQILDIATSGYNDEQITQFSKSEVDCFHCRTTIKPREAIDCGYDPQGYTKLPGKGCQENVEPRRMSLFDVVLYVQREGDGKDTKMVELGWVPLDQFPTPDHRPLREALKDIVKTPFDLAAMYAPDSLDDQAKRLGVPNHFSTNSQQPPPSQPYQGQPAYGAPPQAPPPQYPQPQFGGYAAPAPAPSGWAPPPGPGAPTGAVRPPWAK